MRLIGYGTVLLTLLILSGCGWQVRSESSNCNKNSKNRSSDSAAPKRVLLNDVKIYVVSKLNYDEFIKEYEKKNGADSYIALS